MRESKLAYLTTRNTQLENDVLAHKHHIDDLRVENANLRRDHALQSKVLIQMTDERNDWRDAFELIMKLVK